MPYLAMPSLLQYYLFILQHDFVPLGVEGHTHTQILLALIFADDQSKCIIKNKPVREGRPLIKVSIPSNIECNSIMTQTIVWPYTTPY